MMVYILPIVLFVITLAIILALRAEDKKSRSLQSVKEKIISFRNESTQTINRIQETCHDCTDKIEAKRGEADEIVAQIEASLENLNGKKRDLAALESVCKSYEIALEKLKIQTEHAESRIAVVQKEVDQAELVSKEIEAFKQDAQTIEDNLFAIENNYKNLVDNTSAALDQVASEHEEKHKELLGDFAKELASSREELSVYIEEARAQIAAKENDFTSAASNMIASIEKGTSEYESKCKEDLAQLEDGYSRLSAKFEEQKQEVEDTKASFGEYFDSRRKEADTTKATHIAELDERQADLQSLCGTLLDNLREAETSALSSIDEKNEEQKVQFEALEGKLEEARSALTGELAELQAKVNATVLAVSSEKKEIEEALNVEKKDIANLSEKNKESLESAMKSASDSIEKTLESSLSQIAATVKETEQKLNCITTEASAKVESVKAGADEYHSSVTAEIKSEEDKYVENCKNAIRAIMTEEAERIDGVFKAMTSSTLESIANLTRRQTEIKETVSLLNQGSNETIANTVERLQSLQSKLSASQAAYDEVQRGITSSKEELLALNEQKKSITVEVSRLNIEMENEQDRVNELKKERRDTEGQVARLKLEKESLKDRKQAKPKEAEDSFVFDGDEEQIPLDDDN